MMLKAAAAAAAMLSFSSALAQVCCDDRAFMSRPLVEGNIATLSMTSTSEDKAADFHATAQGSETLKLRTGLLITAVALGAAVVNYEAWWREGFKKNFRAGSEGWFGENTDLGGSDKLGHAFTGYAGTRLLTWSFESLGHSRDRALKLGLITTVAAMTAVEVADGFSKRYRFSPEDAIMNFAGAGLAYLVEKNAHLDALFDFRMHYRRTTIAEQHSFESGQTYVLAIKASGIPALRQNEFLRYLEFAVGYNARGFDEGASDPSRHLYLGLSLNLSELLAETVFSKSRGSRTHRLASGVLEFVQMPGAAAVTNIRF